MLGGFGFSNFSSIAAVALASSFVSSLRCGLCKSTYSMYPRKWSMFAWINSWVVGAILTAWLSSCNTDLSVEEYRQGEGWYGGKRMIKRLNEESGHQENAVLSTWRWDKHSTLAYVHVFRDFQYRVIFSCQNLVFFCSKSLSVNWCGSEE